MIRMDNCFIVICCGRVRRFFFFYHHQTWYGDVRRRNSLLYLKDNTELVVVVVDFIDGVKEGIENNLMLNFAHLENIVIPPVSDDEGMKKEVNLLVLQINRSLHCVH